MSFQNHKIWQKNGFTIFSFFKEHRLQLTGPVLGFCQIPSDLFQALDVQTI